MTSQDVMVLVQSQGRVAHEPGACIQLCSEKNSDIWFGVLFWIRNSSSVRTPSPAVSCYFPFVIHSLHRFVCMVLSRIVRSPFLSLVLFFLPCKSFPGPSEWKPTDDVTGCAPVQLAWGWSWLVLFVNVEKCVKPAQHPFVMSPSASLTRPTSVELHRFFISANPI